MTLDLAPLTPTERAVAIREACVPGAGVVTLPAGEWAVSGPAWVDGCTLDLGDGALIWSGSESATMELRGGATLAGGTVRGGAEGPGVRVRGPSATLREVYLSGLYGVVCDVDSTITIEDCDVSGSQQGLLWHGAGVVGGVLLARRSVFFALSGNGPPSHALYLGEQLDVRLDRCQLLSPAWALQLGASGADDGTRAGSAEITRCDLTDAGQGVWGATRYRARVADCCLGGQAFAVRDGGLLVLGCDHEGEVWAQAHGLSRTGALVARRCRTRPGDHSLAVVESSSTAPCDPWDVADLAVDWSGDRDPDACSSDALVRGPVALRLSRSRLVGADAGYPSLISGAGHDIVLEDVDGTVHGRVIDVEAPSRIVLRGRSPRGSLESRGGTVVREWK
jgi:hypothetical protein